MLRRPLDQLVAQGIMPRKYMQNTFSCFKFRLYIYVQVY